MKLHITKGVVTGGRTWTFKRSDGLFKTYIVSDEGNHGSMAWRSGLVVEMRYNGKTLRV